MNHQIDFSPPDNWLCIKTVDMHTGGEPLRVFVGGLPELRGNTILEKRAYFREHLDHIRTGTMFEPRGHADMYGAVITEPLTENADFGVFFLHNEGYSTMCGHAIIALTKLVLEVGLIRKEGQEVTLNIDAPPGRIVSRASFRNGSVENIVFRNVPSFVLHSGLKVMLDCTYRYDIAYGGAFYAFLEDVGIGLELSKANELIALGRALKEKITEEIKIIHPFEEELGFLYGTIFTGKAEEPSNHSRNVCIFAEGELDRSATGSGVSARAAIHYSRGELPLGEWITIESILGTTMKVRVAEACQFGPYQAVIPEVSGTAYFTGKSEFWFDPEDPLKKGFIVR